MTTYSVTNIYEYDGSLVGLNGGGLVSTNLLNSGSGAQSGTFVDNNTQLTTADSGTTTFALEGMPPGPITYLGAGEIYTIGILGIRLDARPVAAFSVNGQIYFYAPDGLPILSGLTFGLDIDPNQAFNFPPGARVPDGDVDGTDTGQVMGVGYTDADGDQITSGSDLVYGNGGADTVSAGGGADTVYGGLGADSVSGGDGDDQLYGDAEADKLYGEAGSDTLDGGDGNDQLFGGDSNDSLSGGIGNDYLEGGAGQDTLTGGTGADTLVGGADADVFVASGGGDSIVDFDATTGAGDGLTNNNDFVDLSPYYNEALLADWNAAHPTQTYSNPLEWLRADIGDDGILQQVDGLQIKIGATVVDGSLLSAENTGVVCFASGTLIKTEYGEIPVEALRLGDRIMTLDHGAKPIKWIGSRHLSAVHLLLADKLRPIQIRRGALGQGLPHTDLRVSPQHRILVRSRLAQRLFGESEILIAAKKLVGYPGITVDTLTPSVTYWHILLNCHEIIFSNGAPSETLFTGPEALKSVGGAARAELATLFPELINQQSQNDQNGARIFATGVSVPKLVQRSVKNAIPLLDR